VKGIGSRRQADGMATAAVRGDFVLEFFYFRTKGETLRFQDSVNGSSNFIADGSVLSPKIQQWDAHDR
jgi:hypothetical protein